MLFSYSASTLLIGWQDRQPQCKNSCSDNSRDGN